MEYPVRVLHVTGIMNRGGAETMIMNLYRHIDRNKVQFDFVENSFDEEAAYDEEIKMLGGRIYRCPHFNGKNYFIYKKWWKDFFKEYATEYRIVHGHIGSTAAIYLKVANKWNLYTIAHSHNIYGKMTLNNLFYRLLSFPTRYIANYFMGCSEQALKSRFGEKISSNKSSILKNAIEVDKFIFNEKKRNEIRELYNLKNSLVFGHIGRFEQQKNHLFLLRIFCDILSIHSNSVLLLVGDGYLREKIEEEISRLNIENHVILTGVVDNVNDLLQAMDVFIFPSIIEGLPLALVEAQATGLPCLASNTVPRESCLISELFKICDLESSTIEWARSAVKMTNYVRCSSPDRISALGYDIHTTAQWLCNFYLKRIEEIKG